MMTHIIPDPGEQAGWTNGTAPHGLSLDGWLQQADNNGLNGWLGPLPIGKEHKGRYKLPWVSDHHGYGAVDAPPDTWEQLAAQAIQRSKGTAGILALGERLPAGVLGIDVDAYDGKNGKVTLEDWERQWGPLPPTYIVTARNDGVSGIRLYRVPQDYYPKEIPNSGVEFLDRHHRYIVAPPSWHHTGKPYALYLPNGKRSRSGVLPPVEKIPYLPDSYVTGLPALATRAGSGDATSTEVAEFADRYNDGPQPEAVQWVIDFTINSPNADGTRNPTRDALCKAAREAKGKRYGWGNAVDQIRAAAMQAYEARGGRLDGDEFDRLVAYAVGEVRDTDERQLYEAWQDPNFDVEPYTVSPTGEYDPVADSAERAKELTRQQRWYSVQDEIKRLRLEQQWKPIEYQGSLDHQLETLDLSTAFVVEELFPERSICQLNAQYKIGKTTLVTNLVHSLATGEPFLRRFAVHPNLDGHIAHWNMEVSQSTLLGWYRKQGLTKQAMSKVFPLSVRGNLSLDFKSDVVVEWTIKWLQNNNVKVWVIDPLSKLFREDENSNHEFNQWWLKLEHIAHEANLQLVLIVHHTGHANERGRGASAMGGNPDVILSYTHAGNLGDVPPNNRRYLSALGRDVTLPSTEIDFDPDTNGLFCTNSGTTRIQAKSTTKAVEAGVAVWNLNERIKVGDLYKLLKWRQDGSTSKDNAAALKRAVDKGYIVQERNGTTTWNLRGKVDPRSAQDKEQNR